MTHIDDIESWMEVSRLVAESSFGACEMAAASVENLLSVPVRLPANKFALLSDGCKEQVSHHLAYYPPSRRISLTDAWENIEPTCTFISSQSSALLFLPVVDCDAGTFSDLYSTVVQYLTAVSQLILDFWRSPETTRCIADAIQYDVCPTMDLECGHMNGHKLSTSLA